MRRTSYPGLLVFLAIVLLTPPKALAADAYYVPPTQFSAAFQVMDLGFANIFGLFRNATGVFRFDESSKTISHLRLAIDANSLTVSNGEAMRDLSRLFAIAQYPEITFMATAATNLGESKEIKGTLTVHGISKPATFEATLNHVGASPRGGGMWSSEGQAVGLSLRGTFKRADFSMGDEPEIPGRFGETITLLLEMQALRQ